MPKVIPIISSIFFFLLATLAHASAGEITFHGSVIEDSYCQAVQVKNQVVLVCSNPNNALSEADIVSHSQLEYINHEKTAAVMQITYH